MGGRNITFQISDQKAQTWLLFRQGWRPRHVADRLVQQPRGQPALAEARPGGDLADAAHLDGSKYLDEMQSDVAARIQQARKTKRPIRGKPDTGMVSLLE